MSGFAERIQQHAAEYLCITERAESGRGKNAAGILLWRKNLTELHIISETILHTLHKALSQLRYLNIRKTSILNNMRAREEKGDK